MILACCDIGNTKIKIGTFLNDTLTGFISFSSLKETTGFLNQLKPDMAAISSVVPKTSSLLTDFIQKELGIGAFIINTAVKYRLKIDYETTESLGTDRICNCEGAFKLFTDQKDLKEKEILVAADLGTACTINIIDYPGKFTGGLIAPGPGLLFKGMQLNTAQLPEASHSDFKGLIGKSTRGCIASGVRNSVSGLFERVYRKLSEDNIIAGFYVTGGNAPLFMQDFNFKFEYIPELLIHGIKSIYDFNKQN